MRARGTWQLAFLLFVLQGCDLGGGTGDAVRRARLSGAAGEDDALRLARSYVPLGSPRARIEDALRARGFRLSPLPPDAGGEAMLLAVHSQRAAFRRRAREEFHIRIAFDGERVAALDARFDLPAARAKKMPPGCPPGGMSCRFKPLTLPGSPGR